MEVFKKAIDYQSPLNNTQDGLQVPFPTRRNSFTQRASFCNHPATPISPQKFSISCLDNDDDGGKGKNKKLELKNLAGTLLVNKQNTFDSNTSARVVVSSLNSQQQNINDIFSENCGAYNDQDENSSLSSTEMGIKNESNNHLTSTSNDNEGICEVSNTAKNPVKAAFKLGT